MKPERLLTIVLLLFSHVFCNPSGGLAGMNIGADVQQPLDLGGGAMGVFNASSDGRMFCVAKRGAEPGKLQDGLVWACGEGQANCSDIQEGQPCFEPDNLESHASYAYNNYYARDWVVGGTCDFNGTATITQNDPSHDLCVFPPIFLSNARGGPPVTPGPRSSPDDTGSNRAALTTVVSSTTFLGLFVLALLHHC